MGTYVNQPGVYIIQNQETMETYVGSGDVYRRASQHRTSLQKGIHTNHRLQEAYNRNPNFEMVAVPTETRDEAFDIEQAIIDEFSNSPLLLNLSMDARIPRIKHTEETKRRISEANKGRIITPEMRRKISETLTGRIEPDHVRQKKSESRIGLKHSEETRRKISISNTGKVPSEETRKKLSEANKGQIPPNKGIPTREETKRKLSEKNSRPIIGDGVVYSSGRAAAQALGMTPAGISDRIKSPNFPGWKRI